MKVYTVPLADRKRKATMSYLPRKPCGVTSLSQTGKPQCRTSVENHVVWRHYRRCDISMEKTCMTSLSQMWYLHRKTTWCDVTIADRKKKPTVWYLHRKNMWCDVTRKQKEETHNIVSPLKATRTTKMWYDVTISDENRKGRNHYVWCHSLWAGLA